MPGLMGTITQTEITLSDRVVAVGDTLNTRDRYRGVQPTEARSARRTVEFL